MDFSLPEELKMLKDLTKEFVKDELLPIEKQVEQTGEFPEEIRQPIKKKAVELGLYSCAMPAEYGGGGLGILGRVVVSEELGNWTAAIGDQEGPGLADATGSFRGCVGRRHRPVAQGRQERGVASEDATE